MSEKSKKIFLAICIIVPFVVYCWVYYASMIKNAPFRFADFESIEITYGTPGEMLNSYNSKTQIYTYLTKDDKLVTDTLKLRNDDLLYLHRKAQELGFWNVDNDMTTVRKDSTEGRNVARYILKFTYKEKSKEVTLDADYDGTQKMKDAAKSTIDAVLTMLAEAKAR
ncbi:hypothetical protein [Sphingobacterium sp. Mn56C]|uniref:hypothetical protein n=1 Tax=Sphingobacterium sp. Mn56C TaxID=3395261 RepID=UPI003BF5E6BB